MPMMTSAIHTQIQMRPTICEANRSASAFLALLGAHVVGAFILVQTVGIHDEG